MSSATDRLEEYIRSFEHRYGSVPVERPEEDEAAPSAVRGQAEAVEAAPCPQHASGWEVPPDTVRESKVHEDPTAFEKRFTAPDFQEFVSGVRDPALSITLDTTSTTNDDVMPWPQDSPERSSSSAVAAALSEYRNGLALGAVQRPVPSWVPILSELPQKVELRNEFMPSMARYRAAGERFRKPEGWHGFTWAGDSAEDSASFQNASSESSSSASPRKSASVQRKVSSQKQKERVRVSRSTGAGRGLRGRRRRGSGGKSRSLSSSAVNASSLPPAAPKTSEEPSQAQKVPKYEATPVLEAVKSSGESIPKEAEPVSAETLVECRAMKPASQPSQAGRDSLAQIDRGKVDPAEGRPRASEDELQEYDHCLSSGKAAEAAEGKCMPSIGQSATMCDLSSILPIKPPQLGAMGPSSGEDSSVWARGRASDRIRPRSPWNAGSFPEPALSRSVSRDVVHAKAPQPADVPQAPQLGNAEPCRPQELRLEASQREAARSRGIGEVSQGFESRAPQLLNTSQSQPLRSSLEAGRATGMGHANPGFSLNARQRHHSLQIQAPAGSWQSMKTSASAALSRHGFTFHSGLDMQSVGISSNAPAPRLDRHKKVNSPPDLHLADVRQRASSHGPTFKRSSADLSGFSEPPLAPRRNLSEKDTMGTAAAAAATAAAAVASRTDGRLPTKDPNFSLAFSGPPALGVVTDQGPGQRPIRIPSTSPAPPSPALRVPDDRLITELKSPTPSVHVAVAGTCSTAKLPSQSCESAVQTDALKERAVQTTAPPSPALGFPGDHLMIERKGCQPSNSPTPSVHLAAAGTCSAAKLPSQSCESAAQTDDSKECAVQTEKLPDAEDVVQCKSPPMTSHQRPMTAARAPVQGELTPSLQCSPETSSQKDTPGGHWSESAIRTEGSRLQDAHTFSDKLQSFSTLGFSMEDEASGSSPLTLLPALPMQHRLEPVSIPQVEPVSSIPHVLHPDRQAQEMPMAATRQAYASSRSAYADTYGSSDRQAPEVQTAATFLHLDRQGPEVAVAAMRRPGPEASRNTETGARTPEVLEYAPQDRALPQPAEMAAEHELPSARISARLGQGSWRSGGQLEAFAIQRGSPQDELPDRTLQLQAEAAEASFVRWGRDAGPVPSNEPKAPTRAVPQLPTGQSAERAFKPLNQLETQVDQEASEQDLSHSTRQNTAMMQRQSPLQLLVTRDDTGGSLKSSIHPQVLHRQIPRDMMDSRTQTGSQQVSDQLRKREPLTGHRSTARADVSGHYTSNLPIPSQVEHTIPSQVEGWQTTLVENIGAGPTRPLENIGSGPLPCSMNLRGPSSTVEQRAAKEPSAASRRSCSWSQPVASVLYCQEEAGTTDDERPTVPDPRSTSAESSRTVPSRTVQLAGRTLSRAPALKASQEQRPAETDTDLNDQLQDALSRSLRHLRRLQALASDRHE